MGSEAATSSKGLTGASVLLVTADIGARERLARALRAAGAEVAERRHGPAPAVDVLLVDTGTEERTRKDLDLITRDVRMRWSSVVRYPFAEAVPVGAAPDLGGVEQQVLPALAADRALAERLASEPTVETQMTPLGPVRILRAAAATGRTLHVRFAGADTQVDCDLADGLLVCAFGQGAHGKAEGSHALAWLLDLEPAQVTVSERERPEAVNIMEPVGQALELAALERQALLQEPDNDTGPVARPAPAPAPAPAAPAPGAPRYAVGDAKAKKFQSTMLGGQLPSAAALAAAQSTRPEAKTREVSEDSLERVQDERATVAAPPGAHPELDGESPTAAPPPPEAPVEAAAPPAPPVPAPVPAGKNKQKTLFGVGMPKPPAPAAAAKKPSVGGLPKVAPAAAASASSTALPAVDPALDGTLGDKATLPERSQTGTPAKQTKRSTLDGTLGDKPTVPERAAPAKKLDPSAFAGTMMAMGAPPPPPGAKAPAAPADDGLPPAIEDDGLPPAIEDDAQAALERAEEERATTAAPVPGAAAPGHDPLPPEPSREELSVASALKHAIEDIDSEGENPRPHGGPPPPPPIPADGSVIEPAAGIEASSASETERPPSASRRRTLAAVVLVLVAGAGAAVWLSQQQPSPVAAVEPSAPAAPAAAAEPADPGPTAAVDEPSAPAAPAPAEATAKPEPEAQAAAVEPAPADEEAPAAATQAEPAAPAPPAKPAEPEAEPEPEPVAPVAEAAPAAPGPEAEAEATPEVPGRLERDEKGSDRAVSEARDARRDGNIDEAVRLYQEAADLDARNPRAFEGLAEIRLARGQATEAIEAAERAVELRRRRASYRVLLGDALGAAGRPDEARAAYQKALELDPDDREAQDRLR